VSEADAFTDHAQAKSFLGSGRYSGSIVLDCELHRLVDKARAQNHDAAIVI
jgi:hypothetical protein